MSKAKKAVAYPSVFISVVVVRQGNKFCCTDERDGWYLPAGRVDYGECFTTAAVYVPLPGLFFPLLGCLAGLCKLRVFA